jgi:hypothetical protein
MNLMTNTVRSLILTTLLTIMLTSTLPSRAAQFFDTGELASVNASQNLFPSVVARTSDDSFVVAYHQGNTINLDLWDGTTLTALTSFTPQGGPILSDGLDIVADPTGDLHVGFTTIDNESKTATRYVHHGHYDVAMNTWTVSLLEMYTNSNGHINPRNVKVGFNTTDSVAEIQWTVHDASSQTHELFHSVSDGMGAWATTNTHSVSGAGNSITDATFSIDSTGVTHSAFIERTAGMPSTTALNFGNDSTGTFIFATVVDSIVEEIPPMSGTMVVTSSPGKALSMDIDSSDDVHIAYYEYTNDSLHYLTNASGSFVDTIVDTEIDATDPMNPVQIDLGRRCVIDINSTDEIVISYQDHTNSVLKIAHNDGTNPWVIQTIADSFQNGRFIGAGISDTAEILVAHDAKADDGMGVLVDTDKRALYALSFENTVPVADAGGPYIIECGDDITLDASGSSEVDAGQMLTFEWTSADGTFSDATDPAATFVPTTHGVGMTYDITLTVSDSFETDAESTTVSIVDTTKPVITLTGDPSIILEAGVDSYTEQGATVSDSCDATVTVTIGGDPVNDGALGTYVVTYDATDASMNTAIQVTRSVVVRDSLAPEITLTGDATIILEAGIDTYTEQGATVSDIFDAGVTVSIGGDTVDLNTLDTYTVTYNATDSSTNSAIQVTRTVIVQDTTSPVLTLNGAETIRLDFPTDTYTELGATVTDNFDTSITVIIGGETVDSTTVGEYDVTYNATDASTNEAIQVTRTVIVQDPTDPNGDGTGLDEDGDGIPNDGDISAGLPIEPDDTLVITGTGTDGGDVTTALEDATGTGTDISFTVTLSGGREAVVNVVGPEFMAGDYQDIDGLSDSVDVVTNSVVMVTFASSDTDLIAAGIAPEDIVEFQHVYVRLVVLVSIDDGATWTPYLGTLPSGFTISFEITNGTLVTDGNVYGYSVERQMDSTFGVSSGVSTWTELDPVVPSPRADITDGIVTADITQANQIITVSTEGGNAIDAGSSGSGSSCFIATAAYGTPMAIEIDTLREVRDSYLLNNVIGSAFVDTYYRISPTLADSVAKSPTLAFIVRALLTPIVILGKLLLTAPLALLTLLVSGASISIRLRNKQRTLS